MCAPRERDDLGLTNMFRRIRCKAQADGRCDRDITGIEAAASWSSNGGRHRNRRADPDAIEGVATSRKVWRPVLGPRHGG
jgi:hypothetical protein